MKPTILLSALAVLALAGAGCAPSEAPATTPTQPAPSSDSSSDQPMSDLAFPGVRPEAEINKKVRIKTNMGDIVIQVDPEAGPLAASNFVYLVEKGFYDGTIFHRVIPDFMIQGGDPTGTGRGEPGYQFDNDNVGELPVKSITVQGTTIEAPVYEKGIVAMANAGPDTNGSQFFIMVGDYPLPPNYSIFGHVIEGQEIADKISLVDRDAPGQLDRPMQEVKMERVTIEE